MMTREDLNKKANDLKWAAKEKMVEIKVWTDEHKQAIMIYGPIVAVTALELIKMGNQKHLVKEEKRLKERCIYDHIYGHYYQTKRKPRPTEWVMIDDRRARGERLGDILLDMKLLK